MASNRVIAVVSPKGGTGKSTITACLAAEALQGGGKPAIVDADPQQSLAWWHGQAGPLSQITLRSDPNETVSSTIRELAKAHRPVLVDTPGFDNATTIEVLAVADLALIPCGPSPLDALGVREAVKLIMQINQTVERRSRPIKTAVALVAIGRGAIGSHIRAELEGAGFNVLRTPIGNRVAYAEAALGGTAPCWMGAAARNAALEMEMLAAELGI